MEPGIVAIVIAVISAGLGCVGFFSTRDDRIEKKIQERLNDCIPNGLDGRLSAIDTRLEYIDRDIKELRVDVKQLVDR